MSGNHLFAFDEFIFANAIIFSIHYYSPKQLYHSNMEEYNYLWFTMKNLVWIERKEWYLSFIYLYKYACFSFWAYSGIRSEGCCCEAKIQAYPIKVKGSCLLTLFFGWYSSNCSVNDVVRQLILICLTL